MQASASACHRHSCPRAISAAVSLVRALLRSTSKACRERWAREHPGKTYRPSPKRQFLWRPAGSKEWKAFKQRSRRRARRSSRAALRAHSYPIGSSSICARCVRFRESQWSLGGKSPAPPTINHVLVTGVSFAVQQGQLCITQRRDLEALVLSPIKDFARCQPFARTISATKVDTNTPKPNDSPARLHSCPRHLCGRQFGTSSLAIHLKACRERWAREHPGKTPPSPAAPIPVGAPAGSKGGKAFNASAIEKYESETLEPCPHCARTFPIGSSSICVLAARATLPTQHRAHQPVRAQRASSMARLLKVRQGRTPRTVLEGQGKPAAEGDGNEALSRKMPTGAPEAALEEDAFDEFSRITGKPIPLGSGSANPLLEELRAIRRQTSGMASAESSSVAGASTAPAPATTDGEDRPTDPSLATATDAKVGKVASAQRR